MILVLVLGVLLLVPLTGGSYRELRETRLPRESAILVVLFAQLFARAQVSSRYLLGDWAVFSWALLNLLMMGMLWPSRRRMGVSVMVLGVALNVFVVLINGAMPVTSIFAKLSASGGFYRTASAGDHFQILGDVLPIGTTSLVSLGDLLMAVGLVVFVVAAAAGES